MARCYYGCWDSETQALFDLQDTLLKQIRIFEPEAHCAYFPVEGLFQVHVNGRDLSTLNSSRMGALVEALERLTA